MDIEKLNMAVFTERRSRGETSPRLSIQSRGNASVNKATAQALGEPDAVLLLYDQAQRVVGLKAAKRGTRYAYPLRKVTSKSGTYVLSLRALLMHSGLDLEGAKGRYAGVPYDDMLLFDLKEKVE